VGLSLLALGVGLVAGLVAFLAAPSLDELGSGPGGLFGAPALVLLASAVLGLPMLLYSLVSLARGRLRDGWYLVIAVLQWCIAVAFFYVAHAFDPCALGLLDDSSSFLGAPLCSYWGGGLQTAARLHLLHHVLVPALPLMAVQVVLLRRHGRR
jgi:hypothetical protein